MDKDKTTRAKRRARAAKAARRAHAVQSYRLRDPRPYIRQTNARRVTTDADA